jgi:hypothetical protein
MRGRTIAWIVSAAMTLVAAGSLGLGIAGAADSNTSRGSAPEARRGTPVSAIVMGAVVKSNGGLARATTTGITSSRAGGPGSYEVIFPINVKPCTFVATIGKTTYSGVARSGFITTVGRAGEPNGVFVATQDRRGESAKRPFHLEVSCPQPPA